MIYKIKCLCNHFIILFKKMKLKLRLWFQNFLWIFFECENQIDLIDKSNILADLIKD